MNDYELIKRFIDEYTEKINQLNKELVGLVEEKNRQKTEGSISIYETMINTNRIAKKIWLEQKEDLEKQLKG